MWDVGWHYVCRPLLQGCRYLQVKSNPATSSSPSLDPLASSPLNVRFLATSALSLELCLTFLENRHLSTLIR